MRENRLSRKLEFGRNSFSNLSLNDKNESESKSRKIDYNGLIDSGE